MQNVERSGIGGKKLHMYVMVEKKKGRLMT